MLSLGPQARKLHEDLGAAIAQSDVDRLIAVGAQSDALAGAARAAGMDAGCLAACRDIDTAAMLLDCCLTPGDVILVKGSRGMQMERIIERLRSLATVSAAEPLRKAA
jgi:UDP-N-acetylmuramoyl-tripeptide--D-alanyl-D-alanine ligase